MRAPAAVLVAGLALAVGVPTAWAATRPGPAAGPPVASVLSAPRTDADPADPAGAAPGVTARPAAPSAVAPVVPPVRLRLAGVDAPLDPVGVGPDGAMTLPEDVDRVGWYRFGPAPGADEGTAVLAGHVDDAEQGLGALAPLRELDAGAEVEVTDAAGAVTRWRVVSRELIEKRAVPLTALFQRAGPPRLVLLTCGGEFLPELRSYTDNVVVVAEPVS
ncbi:class F sortase [Modestobacter altitudinis]|uniref:class F sortase n=1 Tax=Modestobacter altitudinis TaxID=2213158 RepID=UPI00110D1622|nr:class F sortase [Modestobacter altitudinis]